GALEDVATDADPYAALAAIDAARAELGKLPDKVIPAMAKARSPAVVALGDALARLVAAAVPFDAAVAAHLLPPVLDRIGIDKRERGQFDYQDMLRLVHAVLQDPDRGPELAARLRRRHP